MESKYCIPILIARKKIDIIMRILIIGINVRHIACSAARAGHEVYAIDCYSDLDLQRCASKTALMPRQGAEKYLPAYVELFRPDAVVLGPGLEEISVKGARVLNNSPEKAALVSDKLWLSHWLERKGFPFIRTQSTLEGLQFPAVIKPRKGAGGVGCRLVHSATEIEFDKSLIAQEMIEGLPASVSVIGNGREARALAVNEQLIGASWTGADGFRYCGNITPLEAPDQSIAEMAEEIVAELELVGSNGVDFLLTDSGPLVVEVNPRFQGSLDCVELATGQNIFQAHLQSFSKVLPDKMKMPCLAAGRAIIYATRDMQIEEDLSASWATDVPRPGCKIGKDDPILSILATGNGREEVVALLTKRAATLRL